MCQLDIVKDRTVIIKVLNLRSRRDLAQHAAQLVKILRFCEVEIEAGFSATLDVVTRCKARYRHSFHGSLSLRFDNNVVAVPVRQRDVAQYNVELFGFDHVQRASGVVSRGNVMAEMIQEPG